MFFFSRMSGIFHRGLRYKVQVEGMKFVTSPWALAQRILTVFSQMASSFTLPQFRKKMFYGRVFELARCIDMQRLGHEFQERCFRVIPCNSHPRNPGATYSICACCSAPCGFVAIGGSHYFEGGSVVPILL